MVLREKKLNNCVFENFVLVLNVKKKISYFDIRRLKKCLKKFWLLEGK